MLKNQEYSRLHKEYNSHVEKYNEYVGRIIKIKDDMTRFWKYKNDYPDEWERMVRKLNEYRYLSAFYTKIISCLKEHMKSFNVEYQSLKKGFEDRGFQGKNFVWEMKSGFHEELMYSIHCNLNMHEHKLLNHYRIIND